MSDEGESVTHVISPKKVRVSSNAATVTYTENQLA